MRHFFSTRSRVVLVAALLIAVVLAVVGSLTGTNIPGLLVQGVLTPLRTGVSALTDEAEKLYNYVFDYERMAAENEALKFCAGASAVLTYYKLLDDKNDKDAKKRIAVRSALGTAKKNLKRI